jgi:FAD/FMN-containing dehydrogenase
VAVLLSRLTQCPFAAKSGGHSRFAGASSIDDGILLSLQKLNSIRVSDDKKTVAVGGGNTWGRVYDELVQHDLTVVGGRVAPIVSASPLRTYMILR